MPLHVLGLQFPDGMGASSDATLFQSFSDGQAPDRSADPNLGRLSYYF